MATQHDDGRADDIERELAANLPRGINTQCALVAVMRAITRRMSRGDARRIVGAMPERHRALLARFVDERDERAADLGRAEILAAIASDLRIDATAAEHVAQAVLGALSRALPQELVRNTLAQFPPDVTRLWRRELEAPTAGLSTRRVQPVGANGVPRDFELDHPLLRRLEAMHAVPPGFTSAATFSFVACDLLRRLPRGEALQVVDALPQPVRSLFGPCMAGRGEEPEEYEPRERDIFLDRIARQLEIDRPSGELVARAVFRILQDEMTREHVRHVESQLPEGIAEIWRLDDTRLTEVPHREKIRRAAERAARAGTARPR